MKLKVERCNGIWVGVGMHPPTDMTGWAREFYLYTGLWVVILKVWM